MSNELKIQLLRRACCNTIFAGCVEPYCVEWLISQLKISTYWNTLIAELELVDLEIDDIIEQAKAMQKQQAEHYATFITNCVNNNLPTITFNDWINLDNK